MSYLKLWCLTYSYSALSVAMVRYLYLWCLIWSYDVLSGAMVSSMELRSLICFVSHLYQVFSLGELIGW